MGSAFVLHHSGQTWFGKTSGRAVGEAQWVERHPRVRGDKEPSVKTTHLIIPQVPDRHATLISRIAASWGGEMGINECGVLIAQQNIRTKLANKKPMLTGLDLLRLGLERAATAREACSVMTRLLEKHGQGGLFDYRDNRTAYDSSFLCADAHEAFMIETAGQHWVIQQVKSTAILNDKMRIRSEYERMSYGLQDFAREKKYWNGKGVLDFADCMQAGWSFGSKKNISPLEMALQKQAEVMQSNQLTETVEFDVFFALLREHSDFCQHADNIQAYHTNQAMVAHVTENGSTQFFTGTSAPCQTIFRPAHFDPSLAGSVVQATPHDMKNPRETLWWRIEPILRRAQWRKELRAAMMNDQHSTEKRMLAFLARGATAEIWVKIEELVRTWDDRQMSRARMMPLKPDMSVSGLFWLWQNKRDMVP